MSDLMPNYPFKKAKGNMFLENISLRISGSATNQITTNLGKIKKDKKDQLDSIAPFDFSNFSDLLRNAKKGVRFAIPLSTSVKALKFFTISPSINWDEIWYSEKLTWQQDTSQVYSIKNHLEGFNRVSSYSGSVSVNTRIYGNMFFKKGSIRAIRHVINPSISMNFKPGAHRGQIFFELHRLLVLHSPAILFIKRTTDGLWERVPKAHP